MEGTEGSGDWGLRRQDGGPPTHKMGFPPSASPIAPSGAPPVSVSALWAQASSPPSWLTVEMSVPGPSPEGVFLSAG